jgi:hypothetical protein
MNGNDRRRMEISHPEMFPTSEEREARKEVIKEIMGICTGISMTIMILGAVLIAYTSTRYMGYTGLYIAFFGTMLDVTLGVLIAYHLGNKMQKIYTEKYLNLNVVS